GGDGHAVERLRDRRVRRDSDHLRRRTRARRVRVLHRRRAAEVMRVVTEGARGMANPPGRMSEPIAPARDMAAEAARGDAAPAVEAAGRGKRLRLIPDDPYVGWTPYVWLAFLGIYFAAPLSRLRSGD